MLVAIGLPLTATSASAAVDPGHISNVFPNRDLVMAEGYVPVSAHTVNVLRAGFTVGTVNAVTDAAGFIQVHRDPEQWHQGRGPQPHHCNALELHHRAPAKGDEEEPRG